MDKQQMLAKIYEVIADKTLSFGCLIENNYAENQERYGYTVMGYDNPRKMYNLMFNRTNEQIEQDHDFIEELVNNHVIGHPVMLGDVLHYIHQNYKPYEGLTTADVRPNYEHIHLIKTIREWKQLRLPIDQQSDECIKYVYDLLQQTSIDG